MKKLILVGGFPGSGKSTFVKRLIEEGYTNVNRDMLDEPGKICSSKDFHKHLSNIVKIGWNDKIVVDNTYPSIESRKDPIEIARANGYSIEFWQMGTTIEES